MGRPRSGSSSRGETLSIILLFIGNCYRGISTSEIRIEATSKINYIIDKG